MADMVSIMKIIEKSPLLVTEIGDCPNIELPTNGGNIFWKDVKHSKGWKLQYNYFTGLSRIIDDGNIRKAWGSPVIMEEKFKRLTRKAFFGSRRCGWSCKKKSIKYVRTLCGLYW